MEVAAEAEIATDVSLIGAALGAGVEAELEAELKIKLGAENFDKKSLEN